jgi:ATP-dependent 26S proteasome regulatory subunit
MAATIVDSSDIQGGLESIGGLEEQIDCVWRSVVVPMQYHNIFYSNKGLAKPPRGVLFQGPPGTGKTLMAKAIAVECEAVMFNVNLSSLENKFFGETSKNIRSLYSLARRVAPSVVFIDEIDGIGRERQDSDQSFVYNLKCELMIAIDGLDTKSLPVITIAATNTSASLDAALKRRLSLVIKFDLPNLTSRFMVTKICCAQQGLELESDLMERIAHLSVGASCSDLSEIVRLILDQRQKQLMAQPSFRDDLLLLADNKIQELTLPDVTSEMVDTAVDVWAVSKDDGRRDERR